MDPLIQKKATAVNENGMLTIKVPIKKASRVQDMFRFSNSTRNELSENV